MTPQKVAALLIMLCIAVAAATYPRDELPKWGRIALAVVAMLFGLPPLIALWVMGVF